jgi:hypothetical protein
MDTGRMPRFLERPATNAAHVVQPFGECVGCGSGIYPRKCTTPGKSFGDGVVVPFFPIERRVRIYTDEEARLLLRQPLSKVSNSSWLPPSRNAY